MINGWVIIRCRRCCEERAFVKYKPTELFSGEAQRKVDFARQETGWKLFPEARQINFNEIKPSIFAARFLISTITRVFIWYSIHLLFREHSPFEIQSQIKEEGGKTILRAFVLSFPNLQNPWIKYRGYETLCVFTFLLLPLRSGCLHVFYYDKIERLSYMLTLKRDSSGENGIRTLSLACWRYKI